MVEVGFENRHPPSRQLSQVRVFIVFKQEANLGHGRRSCFCLQKRLRDTPGVQDSDIHLNPLRYPHFTS